MVSDKCRLRGVFIQEFGFSIIGLILVCSSEPLFDEFLEWLLHLHFNIKQMQHVSRRLYTY